MKIVLFSDQNHSQHLKSNTILADLSDVVCSRAIFFDDIIYDVKIDDKFDIKMRTTISLPDRLVREIDLLIETGNIKSRNQLIVEALQDKVKQLKDADIDAQFALMADDSDYIEETLNIELEFANADAEALKTSNNA